MLRSLGSKAEHALHQRLYGDGGIRSIPTHHLKCFASKPSLQSSQEGRVQVASSSERPQKDLAQDQYSLKSDAIHVVDSFATLEAMQRHILPTEGRAMPSGTTDRGQGTSEASNSTATGTDGRTQMGTQGIESPEDQLLSLKDSTSTPDDNKGGGGTLGPRHIFRIVGLDAEWQPSDGFSPVSLLQVSTRSTAFLIDMIWFCRPAPVGWSNAGIALPELTDRERALSSFLSALFADQDILKAGFAFNGDLRNLCRSFPQLPCLGREHLSVLTDSDQQEEAHLLVTSYVDLKRLAFRCWPDTEAVARAMGLAKLTALILGKQLDKTYQVSDWGVRPLTQGQRQYAGADAHVLTALADSIMSASHQRTLGSFPSNLTESLNVATTAKEARLWHKVKATPNDSQVWSWEALQKGLPKERFDPSAPRAALRRRFRERTPRLPTKSADHGVNFAALREFLGLSFPKTGRSVIMQIASTAADGKVPTAVPQYSRGGGVIAWRNSIMLFVNAEPASQAKYANKFLEGGRRLVWFPAPGQTQHHPLIKRMLHATNAQHQQASKQQVKSSEPQDRVLLFCKRSLNGRPLPFVYLGRLTRPMVDWSAGSSGTFQWELQDYATLIQRPAFSNLLEVLGDKEGAK